MQGFDLRDTARGAQPRATAVVGRSQSHVRRFDGWAASYDRSQLQTVLYGPVHDAALRRVRQQHPRPRRILDVGCGTGRLPTRLVSAYHQARVVGVDASTGMVENAVTAPGLYRARFAAATAERLPFADAVFDLVVVTLSVFHWRDMAAGVAEITRVMAPNAALVAAEVLPFRPSRPAIAWIRPGKRGHSYRLPLLIAASGLDVERIDPIRSVALIADVALITAKKPR